MSARHMIIISKLFNLHKATPTECSFPSSARVMSKHPPLLSLFSNHVKNIFVFSSFHTVTSISAKELAKAWFWLLFPCMTIATTEDREKS